MEKEKKAGIAVLISNKIEFKTKEHFVRDKGHYIMVKGTFKQEDTTLVTFIHPT